MFLAHLIIGILIGLTGAAVALLAGTPILGALGVYALAGILSIVASVGVAALARSPWSTGRAPTETEIYPAE